MVDFIKDMWNNDRGALYLLTIAFYYGFVYALGYLIFIIDEAIHRWLKK